MTALVDGAWASTAKLLGRACGRVGLEGGPRPTWIDRFSMPPANSGGQVKEQVWVRSTG